jgi:hypothetical protein
MLTADDIIRLPYTDDLTLAGIAYALRSLAYTYDRMGGTSFERLRRIVAGKAVELAFRRHLDDAQVPYDTLGATPFTDPDRYDVALGGHRCDIKSFVVAQRQAIQQVRQNPAVLLEAAALVPSDQLAAGHLRDYDLYVFAFVLALFAAHSSETRRAQEANQPVFLMHTFPTRWSRPGRWQSLGGLALKLESGPALQVEVGGQTAEHGFAVERVQLVAGQRLALSTDFFSLAYLSTHRTPEGRLGIRSAALAETFLVEAVEWGNIWVYGMDIYLAGYLAHAEFRRRACLYPVGSQVWQYKRTRTDNHGLGVGELSPLKGLLARVRAWDALQKATQTE